VSSPLDIGNIPGIALSGGAGGLGLNTSAKSGGDPFSNVRAPQSINFGTQGLSWPVALIAAGTAVAIAFIMRG